MRRRSTRNWPLSDNRAFFEINDLEVAVAPYNISHGNIQSLARWLDGEATWIGAIHLDAAQQFCCLGVDDLDGTIGISCPGDDGRVIYVSGRVVRCVIRCSIFGATSASQLDSFSYLVRSAAYGNDSVISKVGPDFIGLRDVNRLARIPP